MSRFRTATIPGGLGLLAGIGWAVSSGLLDGTPPTIQVDLPHATVRGAVDVSIHVTDPAPGVGTVTARVDDEPPVRIELDPTGHAVWTIPARPEQDGPHTVTIEATDRAWSPNTARQQGTYTTDHTPPTLEWAMVPGAPAQGETAALFVRAGEPLTEPHVSGLEQTRPLRVVHPHTLRALIGLGVKTPAGEQTIDLLASDQLGNTARCSIPVSVRETDFPRGGTIRLSNRQVAARRDTTALDKMRADRNAAYRHVEPTAYWHGPIVRPIVGRRTSAFGRYRTYSDGRKKHHLGTDLANITGTPVRSALGGIVRAAGWQHLFGNAVIVHHGQGLTTSYNHLSRLDVAEGDTVEAGDIVGAVGSTGQSTGPHLHWGMQVGEIEVDPERWPDHGFEWAALAETLSWQSALDCTPQP